MQSHSPYRHYRERSSTHNQLHIHQNSSLKKNTLQQKQIDDLQKKIDIILMHNEKLMQQNQHLKQTIRRLDYGETQRYLQGNTARFIAEQTQLIVNKLKYEHQLAKKSYEIRLKESINEKTILKQEIITLNQIIKNIRIQNESLKAMLNQKHISHQQDIYKLKQELARSKAQMGQKLKDQILIRQQQMNANIRQVQRGAQQKVQQKQLQTQLQKKDIKENFQKIIKRLNQNQQNQIEQIKKQMHKNFKDQISQLQEQFNQKLKIEKEKAQNYIKSSIQSIKSDDENIKRQLQLEIQNLKNSLESRKTLIDQLINSPEDQNQIETNWYKQFLQLKSKVKQITDYYLRQTQVLKLKVTQKHQIDIKSMVKIYQDKIELMNLHIKRVQSQNQHLRNIYQDSLNKKISQKKQFQIQISKLKNLIRKLKVELHGIQEEFRLNIEGVKQNNNTFSMTMMKSMIQIKDKANFYQEENRKLRKAYEEHEIEVHQAKKQADQKKIYFQQKYKDLKQKMEEKLQEYRQYSQNLISDSQKRQNMLRESLQKQHQMSKFTIQSLKQQILKLQKAVDDLKVDNHELQLTFKDKQEEISYFKTLSQQKEADIQRLKMDLQMAGLNDKDKVDTINQWKNHYERELQSLKTDKQILKSQLEQKQNNLCDMIKKYKILQGSVEKSVQTLKKRSLLDKRVMQLGLDNNLVKNLAELFCKQK